MQYCLSGGDHAVEAPPGLPTMENIIQELLVLAKVALTCLQVKGNASILARLQRLSALVGSSIFFVVRTCGNNMPAQELMVDAISQ